MKILSGSVMQQAAMQMKQQTMSDKNTLFQKNIARKEAPMAHSSKSLVAEVMKEKLEKENVLRKIARGERLSEQEKAKLEEISPDERQKAEAANEERKNLSQRVAQAKTEKQAREVIAQAKTGALAIFDKGDQLMGMLLLEVANKVEEEIKGQKTTDFGLPIKYSERAKQSKEDIPRLFDQKK
ncbi:hypothetical protein CH76_02680 [Lysinibacillus sp. BF-4]|uniref:hypothetical protein n=1 Tax=Lysinibacillus sp. BF-4 TaxID=1473546 RepID=UPI000503EEA7|nr:hypothetical protein [Lysinibacillus sp. BF-4]KFL44214.1 hypothetical protein CH76_02680 [Lysinibacillus sp. BF-4]